MNCEQAKPHLSAYSNGTLSALIREDVGEHLATCAVCREQVERALAAIDAARENESKSDTWTSKLRLIPKRAMGPQVSMAMVLLLMVGVGLVYLPRLQRSGALEGGRLIDGSSPGRSDGIMPAARLDLALDPRNHRIRTREEEEAMAEAAAIAARALASRDAGAATDAALPEDAGLDSDAAVALEATVPPTPDEATVAPLLEPAPNGDAPHPEKLPPAGAAPETSAPAAPDNAAEEARE